jgi:hypothetical protein
MKKETHNKIEEYINEYLEFVGENQKNIGSLKKDYLEILDRNLKIGGLEKIKNMRQICDEALKYSGSELQKSYLMRKKEIEKNGGSLAKSEEDSINTGTYVDFFIMFNQLDNYLVDLSN